MVGSRLLSTASRGVDQGVRGRSRRAGHQRRVEITHISTTVAPSRVVGVLESLDLPTRWHGPNRGCPRLNGGDLDEIEIYEQFVIKYKQTSESALTVADPIGESHELRQLAPGQILRTMSNGLTVFQQLDLAGRIILSAQWFSSNPDGATFRVYSYSVGGKLLSIDDSVYGETNFVYDAAHRLEKIHRPNGSVDVYGYDASGTVNQRPGLELSVSQGRVVGAGGKPVEYDERGRIRTRTFNGRMLWYYYDSLDRLIAVKYSDGERYDYEYDGFSRRIRARGPKGEHRFIWEGHRLAAEVLPGGAFRVYVYPDDLSLVPIALVDYESVEDEFFFGRARYPLTNQMGCPELVQDTAGEILWAASVDPHGLASVTVGASFHQPLRLPGQYFDTTVGLSFTRFRVYAPDLCCFLQSNPVGLAGGLNLQSRCHNPLAQLDVTSLGATAFCGHPSRTRSPETMPLCERDDLRLPDRILEAQELLVKTAQDVSRSRDAAFAALQTCRQVMSRNGELIAEYDQRVRELEKHLAELSRHSEESFYASLATGRFVDLEQKASTLVAKMLGAGDLDEDMQTRIAMTQAWKRFTVRGGM
jgi:RHS repeat-associated protein